LRPLSITFILSLAFIFSCKEKIKVTSFYNVAKVDSSLRRYFLANPTEGVNIDSINFRVDSLTEKNITTEQAYLYKAISETWNLLNHSFSNLDYEKYSKKEVDINTKYFDSLYNLTLKDAENKDSLTLLGFRVYVFYSPNYNDGVAKKIFFMTTACQIFSKSKYLKFEDRLSDSTIFNDEY
jgi:hypothetical protein